MPKKIPKLLKDLPRSNFLRGLLHNKPKDLFKGGLTILISILAVTAIVKAGTLTPSATPSATSYTLEDIYIRLTANTAATEANHDLSTTTSPAASFYTLTQIYDSVPTINAAKLLDDTTYLGITGTMADNGSFSLTASSTDQTVTAGYYSGGTLSGDADLIAGNVIRDRKSVV